MAYTWAALRWLVAPLLVAMLILLLPTLINQHKLPPTQNHKAKEERAMPLRTQSIRNIYHIVFILQQKLVRDVIPAILEYAELYECTSIDTTFRPIQTTSQHQAPRQILVCEIPKSIARVQRPVRAIMFKINSHDQGFASDRNGGSWTWFTAQKLSIPDSERFADMQETLTAPIVGEYKEIIRNPIASSRWCTHEVVWRADSSNAAEAQWVSSLRAGEVFAVQAWARFPAWTNYVSDVSVKIYTVAVA